ncbi:MAG: glycosyltransferase family 2 protein [Candidatus Methanoperedens sp.]|nr:glycosyltransferase family 2 protein [Candidatus Methanoperedens sp.]
MKTSLVIPAYNEEEALPSVLEEYMDKVDEIIVVDDGSNDKTYEIAKKNHVQVYKHEINKGKVAALRTGVANASGDIIIFTDADCTYPAKYVPQFISEIEKGADLVLGSRFLNGINNMPLLNMIGNKLFSLIAAYISCINISDGQTGYRAFRKENFGKLDVKAVSLEYETKMTVRAAKLGYKIVEIPIEYRKRVGTSKLRPIRDGAMMFRGLMSIAYKETSLIAKIFMMPSIFFILVGFSFGAYSIYEKVWNKVLQHEFYPLIASLFILIALQLISVGLIMDYIVKKLDRIEEKLKSG